MICGAEPGSPCRRRKSRRQDPFPRKTVALVAGLVALGTATASAQDAGTISAERPGFSSSPIALAPSLWQIESGYQYTKDSGSIDVDDHTLPLLLVRAGLTERVELQFSWAGISWSEIGGRSVDGANDAGIGVKWQLTDDNAALPFAVFAGLSLPIGADELTSDEVEPTIGAFWSYSAGMDWFGTLLLSESDDDIVASNGIGLSIPINDDTGGYVEYFGNYAGDSGPEHYINGGVAYLPRMDLQLDLHLGAGLNGRAADFFLGVGVAYRF